jgi:hypothetical protein
MKNIHLIATDKPTGIFQSNSGLQFSIRDKIRVEPLKGFHIYITSDEVIKEDDWGLSKLNEVILFGRSYNEKFYKKIILTTDQDLIKDGVRAIGDDFLEWFVKNSDCESIKTLWTIPAYKIEKEYRIEFPQEKAKQETLEEAAKNNYPKGDIWTEEQAVIRRLAFKNGAKWQAEKSYSEKEVLEIINRLGYDLGEPKSAIEEWFEQFKKEIKE